MIELLVTVSIVALIIALLMPALGQARTNTHVTECMSSMHHLAIGYAAYQLNHDGYLMGGMPANHPEAFVRNGGGEAPIKDGALWPYVERLIYYKCPEDIADFDNPDEIDENLRSYVLPGVLNGEGWNSAAQGGTNQYSNIVNPSAQLLWFEEGDWRGYNVGSWLLRVRYGREYSWIDAVGLFHKNNTADNLGYLDGHVETKQWFDKDTRNARIDHRFYLHDLDSVDWDWMRPRYRQLPETDIIPYLHAGG